MSYSWSGGTGERTGRCGNEAPNRPLRLDTQTIFREMIARELRCGRLTKSSRARIVRYASQMGLSAVEAGELIGKCRDDALLGDDPEVRTFALRLVEPLEPRIPTPLKIAGVILIAIIIWKLGTFTNFLGCN